MYTELGRGTSVKMYLPRHVASGVQVEPRPEGTSYVPGKGETVLVVEDDPLVRAHALDAPEELGYVAVEAEDAIEALTVSESHPEVAVLFTDLVLPR